MQLSVVGLILCSIAGPASSFTCDLAKRPEIIIPNDKVAPLIRGVELVKSSLEVMFGSVPGSSVVLFVVEKLLTSTEDQPSVWDQVKDKVEKLIMKKIDEERIRNLCTNLKEFRRRIDLCELRTKLLKTACYSSLLDYMIGQEPHFTGDKGRDVALTLGIYTVYSVMTLSVGKVFLKANSHFKLKGEPRLKRLKVAARGFSSYVNQSVPTAVEWRRMEIGKYRKYKFNWFSFHEDGKGLMGVSRKRSAKFEEVTDAVESNKQYTSQLRALADTAKDARNLSDSIKKRGTSYPAVGESRGKLVVTDEVLGTTIFEKEAYGRDINVAYKKLFDEAEPIVARLRDEEGAKLARIYEEQVLPITNQYWRVYERTDFGTAEAEASNKDWLTQVRDVGEVVNKDQL